MSMRSHLCLSVFSELLESYCSGITNCVAIFSESLSYFTSPSSSLSSMAISLIFSLLTSMISNSLDCDFSCITSPHVTHDSFAATQLWSCLWPSDLIWPMELCIFLAGAPHNSRWQLLPHAGSWTEDDLQLNPQLTWDRHGTWLKVSFLA